MKIDNAIIRIINPVQTGVSQASGKAWASQSVVVSWPETLNDGRVVDNYQLCTLHGEQVERFAQLNVQPGAQLKVDIAFNTRQYNGRVYNDNSLYL